MTDIATLGIAVNSDPLKTASSALEDFSGKAGKAERATDKLQANLAKMERAAVGLHGTMATLAGSLGVAFGGAAFGSGIINAIKRMDEMESRTRKIDRALAQNGYTFDLTTKKIKEFAAALEARTGTQAGSILDLAPNLASFGFTEKAALRSIELANDMAAAWGGDLRQNFEGLGRALADPVKGFAMLSARGITLDNTQKKLVKSLVESGQGLKAQEVVFKTLESQVKGIAEAGYAPLKKATDLARKSVEDFFDTLVSSGGLGNTFISILNSIASAMNFLGENIGTISTALGIFAAGHIASGLVSIVSGIDKMVLSMGTATTVARGLSLAMGFVGGPVGLAVIALGGAYLLLGRNVSAAEKAVLEAEAAFRTNQSAMDAAKGASNGYSKALRDQIAMQVEVAKSAYTMADATFTAAAKTAAAFAAFSGFRYAVYDYDMNVKDQQASALYGAYEKLRAQLETVDKNLAKPPKIADREFGEFDTKAAESAAKAYRDLIKSANDRIDQMKLEAQTAGLTGVAAETMRFKLDLLQKAQDKGRSISEAQRLEIEKLAQTYGVWATAAAKATLQQDLLFERAQLGRTEIERTIASTLRGAGLEVNFNSAEAGMIRMNEQLKITKDAWEQFGNSAEDALMGLIDGSSDWQDVLKSMIPVLKDLILELIRAQSIGAGGGGASGLGGLLSSFFGGGKSDPWSGLRLASGGPVSGPGTGTSDSIMAMLSNGEFVMSAASTKLYGPLLQAMNDNKLPGFASGGPVGDYSGYGGKVVPMPAPASIPNRAQSGGGGAQSGGDQGVHVTLGWAKDADGNIAPIIKDVSQQTFKQGIAVYEKGSVARTSNALREGGGRGYLSR